MANVTNNSFPKTPTVSATSQDNTQTYVVIGICFFGIFASCLSLAVLLINANLRRNFHMFFAHLLGDFCNCMGYGLATTIRLIQTFQGISNLKIPPVACLKQPYPFFFLLGNQLTPLASLAMSLERFCAVTTPIWFLANWTNKKASMVALGVTVYSLLSTVVGYLVTGLRDQSQLISISCTTQTYTGVYYGGYNYFLSTFADMLAVVISLVALVVVQFKIRRHVTETDRLDETRRQRLKVQRLRTLGVVLVTVVSAVLTLPAGLRLFGTTSLLFDLPPITDPTLSRLSTVGYSINSSLTIFALCATNSDFRTTLWSIITLKIFKQLNKVYAFNGHGFSSRVLQQSQKRVNFVESAM